MHKVRGEVIIVVVHVEAVKIYVAAAVEALKEKGKTGSKPDETQFGTKSGAFLSLIPSPEG
jgi:hypothetical protein